MAKNRIVVNYDFEDLILLGAIENSSAVEVPYDELKSLENEFTLVKRYEVAETFEELKERNTENKEGFVIRFSNGDRMKIKFEEYIRLHRINDSLTSKMVWGVLAEGDESLLYELIKDIPDESYGVIHDYVNKLKRSHFEISELVGKYFDNILENYNYELPDGKTFSEIVKLYPMKYSSILWRMYHGRPYDDLVWKMLKPEFEKLL